MTHRLVVRCVQRTEDLRDSGVVLDPRPDEPQPEGQIRGFWLRMSRGDACQFALGEFYEMVLTGPVEKPL